MKFYINKIILWMKNEDIRTLDFIPNKVNVITGDSGTGKSVILDIIDYCLFASESDIPQEIVNENVKWYGLNFHINDKEFTIARKCLKYNGTAVSSEYYFSAVGKTPKEVSHNMNEDEIKKILEYEFSIDSNVVFAHGGNQIRPGTKISLRYFLMFNMLDGDTICHSKVFFIKQDNERYKEALPRIFDLATGINNIDNILLGEKILQIQKEITRLERKQNSIEKENELFQYELSSILRDARKYGVIDEMPLRTQSAIIKLQDAVNNVYRENLSTEVSEIDTLKKRRRNIIRKIKLLNKLESEYSISRELVTNEYDSLKPIDYIIENYEEIIKHSHLNEFFYGLKNELIKIRKSLRGKSPLDIDIKNKRDELNSELDNINEQISLYPEENVEQINDVQKYLFIGEIKNKISMYTKSAEKDDYTNEILKKEKELLELQEDYIDVGTNREIIVKLLEELIQSYLDLAGKALDNYAGFKAYFNYKKKILQLIKPLSSIPSKVGSSSNHLFLHICLFLGLHDLTVIQKVPYIPQMLILDQPSRPYFEYIKKTKNLESLEDVKFDDIGKDDRSKITTVFKLFDSFINNMKENLNEDFQMIVLEHVPRNIWEDAKLENIHLVEEFINGNALIR
ncbi:DUF3732 domain-containing protein [Clostridium beijerinckii]|uniref:DUF3732 domain-containing protein n=1 Tax=Clostridium beijerinckii TaxID=1520 RepID=UPI001F3D1B89|nr:DUF3732 domain-containing protein [Clostridium beijerinckii]